MDKLAPRKIIVIMVNENSRNEGQVKVLIVEDNDFDFELVERKLRKMNLSFEVKRAAYAKEFENYLIGFTPDIILSDFSIPSYNGMKALEFAKVVQPEVPFIFVSGSIGEERAVEALKQGAADYVLKDNLNKLEPSVRRALAEVKEKVKRREAEEKLRIKNKELRSLVYRISHDFKAPVCTIQGVIHLFQLAEKKEDFLLYANLIESVTVKLDGIINNLKSFQHLFADELQLSRFDLGALLEEVTNAVSIVEGFKQVKMNAALRGERSVFCERNFLFSLLYNLLHNSIVFSDKCKASRMVNCEINCSPKELSILVEDDGVGISERVKERMFEMFYRGNVASKGAGLGLYIVKSCTDLLNGELTVDTKEGVGTKVAIRIPALCESNLS